MVFSHTGLRSKNSSAGAFAMETEKSHFLEGDAGFVPHPLKEFLRGSRLWNFFLGIRKG